MKSNPTSTNLETIVGNCLPKLAVLWTAIDTYGCPQNAAVLREVIDELREAIPPRAISTGAKEFVVSGLFRIPRSQVAQLVSIGLSAGPTASYEIVDVQRPPTLAFRSTQKSIVELDYPLNEGGSLGIVRKGMDPDGRRLDLESISEGLNVMATHYPRHFADFLNEAADAVTADVFLQCCLFGELICG
jgi:hypothetical protein